MAKFRAGKCQPAVPNNALLSAFYADRKLSKQRKSTRWKLAAAAAVTPFLLIAPPQR